MRNHLTIFLYLLRLKNYHQSSIKSVHQFFLEIRRMIIDLKIIYQKLENKLINQKRLKDLTKQKNAQEFGQAKLIKKFEE